MGTAVYLQKLASLFQQFPTTIGTLKIHFPFTVTFLSGGNGTAISGLSKGTSLGQADFFL